jgi:hypothetical protein
MWDPTIPAQPILPSNAAPRALQTGSAIIDNNRGKIEFFLLLDTHFLPEKNVFWGQNVGSCYGQDGQYQQIGC